MYAYVCGVCMCVWCVHVCFVCACLCVRFCVVCMCVCIHVCVYSWQCMHELSHVCVCMCVLCARVCALCVYMCVLFAYASSLVFGVVFGLLESVGAVI